jgi:hypothetical protein
LMLDRLPSPADDAQAAGTPLLDSTQGEPVGDFLQQVDISSEIVGLSGDDSKLCHVSLRWRGRVSFVWSAQCAASARRLMNPPAPMATG